MHILSKILLIESNNYEFKYKKSILAYKIFKP